MPAIRKITYIMSILSAAEARKKKVLRKPKTTVLKLDSNEPWECLQAQFQVKFDDALHPPTTSFSSFEVAFHIPRIVSKPGLSLCEEADYEMMIAKALTTKDHTVNIEIEQLPLENDKENISNEDEPSQKKKKKGVSHVYMRFAFTISNSYQARIDPATLPGNRNKNTKITDLRDKYLCKKNDAACPGTHCYDSPGGDHIILGHTHFDCWAAAIVRPFCFPSHIS